MTLGIGNKFPYCVLSKGKVLAQESLLLICREVMRPTVCLGIGKQLRN